MPTTVRPCSTRYGTVLLATVPNSDASYTLTFDTLGLASTVSWSVSEGSYFRLSRSTASDSGYTQLYAGNDMTFYDANLVGGVTNYYKLQICSNIDSATCLSLAAAASSSIEFGTPFLGDYAYYAAANADQDFTPSGVGQIGDLWSDGDTMWVINRSGSDRVLAYNLSTKSRVSVKDTVPVNGNPITLSYIWSDGAILWAFENSVEVHAFQLGGDGREFDLNFDLDSDNADERGMWSDGTTLWVADDGDDKIYAYNFITKARDENQDFNSLDAADNQDIRGIWSDGFTMWVVNNGNDVTDKVFAYNMSTKQRDATKDINTLSADSPYGIWSDGTTFWISDDSEQVHAYDTITNIEPTTQSSTQQIALSWASISGATHYILYSSTQSDGVYAEISTGSSTSYTDIDLTVATEYYYQLSACGSANDSDSCTDRYGSMAAGTLPNSNASATLTFDTSGSASTVTWQVSEGSYFRLSRSTRVRQWLYPSLRGYS